MKNVLLKFQAKLFKNNCDCAHFLWDYRLLACNFTKIKLLQKYFQGFFLDYQSIYFPEQLFMGHSWQKVSNSPYVMKTLLYCLSHQILSKPSFLLPSTFTSTSIFNVLFLWLNGWSCHIGCVISLNDNMDLSRALQT